MKQIDEVKLAAIFDKAKAEAMALLTDLPTVPEIAVEHPIPITDYSKTFRYSKAENAWKFSLFKPGIYKSFAPAKGSVNLDYYQWANPTPLLGMPRITNEGLLFFNNQKNTLFMADISDKPKYPFEMWYVWHKPDYFINEKMIEEPCYTGENGTPVGVRLTNEDKPQFQFNKAVYPVNRPFIYRLRLTENPKGVANVELWIDGVKQTNSVQVQTWYRNHFTIGAGVNTNNSYIGWAEVFNTPVLSDTDGDKVTAELKSEYKPFDLPIATDITYTKSASGITVSFKPNIPAKIKWVDMSKGIELATYAVALQDKLTVPSNFIGRAEVTVVDAQGRYFDIPSTKIIR